MSRSPHPLICLVLVGCARSGDVGSATTTTDVAPQAEPSGLPDSAQGWCSEAGPSDLGVGFSCWTTRDHCELHRAKSFTGAPGSVSWLPCVQSTLWCYQVEMVGASDLHGTGCSPTAERCELSRKDFARKPTLKVGSTCALLSSEGRRHRSEVQEPRDLR
ncbi:MAG: hypothetical protein JNK04_01300 [Myxococcales bacterium]|nr:hypothetical protein [Myxococcales bacterium]